MKKRKKKKEKHLRHTSVKFWKMKRKTIKNLPERKLRLYIKEKESEQQQTPSS
jgi:hypothetical protein